MLNMIAVGSSYILLCCLSHNINFIFVFFAEYELNIYSKANTTNATPFSDTQPSNYEVPIQVFSASTNAPVTQERIYSVVEVENCDSDAQKPTANAEMGTGATVIGNIYEVAFKLAL